jgi:ribonuclease G
MCRLLSAAGRKGTMAKEICISSTPHETRLAILEDDQLAEIYYERENEYTLAGSIYNGRVTRVLPGMQSAFVDLGLERDAFLYVTDFMELDDQEETDELEKAAASGAGQPPREVRHPRGVNGGGVRQPEQVSEERGSRSGPRRQEPRQDRPVPEEVTVEIAAPEPASAPASAETEQEQEGTGGRPWRGRRRRRGGRGQKGLAPEAAVEAEPAVAGPTEPVETVAFEETPKAREIHPASPAPRVPHGQPVPAAFVLPGESLRKYGGTAAADSPKAAADISTPPRPSSTFKPSTLIEAPIAWDGSGLLPGESISRHRVPQPEPDESGAEAEAGISAAPHVDAVTEETVEEKRQETEASYYETETETEEPEESALEFEEESLGADAFNALAEEDVPELETAAGAMAEDDEFEETMESAPAESEAVRAEPTEAEEVTDEETDASASHRVDPSSPTGFRLFGFGKKKEEEASATKAAAPASTYAPGVGLVEEETIEGEEFEAAPRARRHKPEAHDGDVYEEETLPTHLRTGDFGEMLQEAHLDHRIQRDLDEPNGEEEDETGEEETTTPGTRPARNRERRDRGPRGRGTQRRGPSRRSAQTSDLPIISDLLKSGQEILVQIAKEPIAKKGARITSHIALPGRFLVFMPTVSHVGVSRKIASDEERHRLKRILLHERGDAPGGLIVRTAAEGASEEELRADLRFLMNLWNDIKQRSEASNSPALIYHDLQLIERILRDQVSANFSSIWVDTEANYERIVKFLNHFSPTLVRRVKLYTKETPLFEHFGVEDEISKALRSKVWLKSGGSIVINQTEALVAIDINTGKYVGKSARLEDTILKTNLDAVPEIVRQIRLRDLGGIIVIDFIDMDERKNRFKVMAALEEALKNDRAPTKVLQFNDFGLVAITRKRVKQSLERTLSVPCPTCQATGMVKSATTVCNEIYIEMRKMRKHFENADVMLRVHPETVKVLKSNNARWLTEFDELIGRNLLLKSDAALHPEQFDIQG